MISSTLDLISNSTFRNTVARDMLFAAAEPVVRLGVVAMDSTSTLTAGVVGGAHQGVVAMESGSTLTVGAAGASGWQITSGVETSSAFAKPGTADTSTPLSSVAVTPGAGEITIVAHVGDNTNTTIPIFSSITKDASETASWTKLESIASATSASQGSAIGEVWGMVHAANWAGHSPVGTTTDPITAKAGLIRAGMTGGTLTKRFSGKAVAAASIGSIVWNEGDLVIVQAIQEDNTVPAPGTLAWTGTAPAGTMESQTVGTTGGSATTNVGMLVQWVVATNSSAGSSLAYTPGVDGGFSVTVLQAAAVPLYGAAAMASVSTLSAAGDVTGGVPTHAGAVDMASSSTLTTAAVVHTGYAAEVMADGPLWWARLNETSGAIAADSSGNGRHGAYTGTPTLGAGSLIASDPADTAMTLASNGTAHAEVPTATWMNLTDLTAEVWVEFASTSIDGANGDAIFSRYMGLASNWLLWRNTSGKIAVQVRNSANTGFNVASAITPVAGQDYQVAFTLSGTTLTLYVDGAPVGSTTITGSLGVATAALEVGRYSGSDVTVPSATFDEAIVYGAALSPARILAHYNAASAAVTHQGAVAMSATSSLVVDATATAAAQGAVAMSSSSTLEAAAVVEGPAAVAMSSTSTLDATGSGGALAAAADLQATSTLTVAATVTSVQAGIVAMSSTSTLVAAASGGAQAGAVAMASTSTLTTTARATFIEQYRIPLGMTTLAFGRGSVLLPYAGAEAGSQALDFSLVTEAPASGLFPPQDGPADSRSIWIAVTSTASQTLTVTPTAAFAVGLEVWDGDPATDPTGLSLVASGTGATLDVAVSAGQKLLIRVHPMSSATSGTGSVAWSVVARPDSGILQFYAAPSIFETPGWIPANVAAATPGGTLEFTLDGSPTVVFTAVADTQGLWADSRVLLPQLAVGTHTITVTDVATGQTASRTFTVEVVPPAPAGGVVVPPPSPPAFVQRWYLEDAGGEHFAFPINPSGMTSPHPTRAIVAEHTLSPTGRAILWEGIGEPTTWTITGSTETQAFYEALERFHEMERRVYLTDHLARIWTVSFESLDLVEQKSAENSWAYTYTAKFLILDGPVTA